MLDTRDDEWLLNPGGSIVPLHTMSKRLCAHASDYHRRPLPNESSERQSRRLAYAGLGCATAYGLLTLIGGVILATLQLDIPGSLEIIGMCHSNANVETYLPYFIIIFLTTCATGAIGYVHSVTQKSSLAIGRLHPNLVIAPVTSCALRFNTNFRFFKMPQRNTISFFHPNNIACNSIMASLLTVSYASASLCIVTTYDYWASTPDPSSCGMPGARVLATPLIVLGVSILVQSLIAIIGITKTDILTWSSSPLDTTAATILSGAVVRIEGLCLCDVLDVKDQWFKALQSKSDHWTAPPARQPKGLQPSAWQVRRGVKRTIVLLWALIVIFVGWGGVVSAITAYYAGFRWSFFPSHHPAEPFWPRLSFEITHGIYSYDGQYWGLWSASPLPMAWVVCYVFLAVLQGALTMALHCCELIVNSLRDENNWRKAATESGTESVDPLRTILFFWPSCFLQVAKPCLHSMLGLCISFELGTATIIRLQDESNSTGLSGVTIVLRATQMWNFSLMFALLATCMTYLAVRRPKGVQPAAYGHIQTLSNLVDEWPEKSDMKLWWGYKSETAEEDSEGSLFCAGTSGTPLASIPSGNLHS